MTQRSDIIALADLPLFWQGRAKGLSLLNGSRSEPDARTIGLIETYEECAKELRAALSTDPATPTAGGDEAAAEIKRLRREAEHLKGLVKRYGEMVRSG